MMTSGQRLVRRGRLIALLAGILGLAATAPACAFESGKGVIEVVVRETPITVYTYRPNDCAQPKLLFVFHGLGRKAGKIRDNAIQLADRACLIVLAPLFDSERFPNWRYHRAGVVRRGDVQPKARWTGPIVDALIAWGRRWTGDPAIPYLLFGHSAGAQFLSRLAAYSPPRHAERIVIANASVHVLPSFEEAAPQGFRDVYEGPEAERRLRAYLAAPITIYLGEQDTGDKHLVQSAAARRQGANRLERGLNVFRRAWELAKRRGWRLNWRTVTAPGVGHSSEGMLSAPTAERAFHLPD